MFQVNNYVKYDNMHPVSKQMVHVHIQLPPQHRFPSNIIHMHAPSSFVYHKNFV